MTATETLAKPQEPRLTSLSHGGGCGCKIAPGVLSRDPARASAACRCRQRAAGRHRDRRRRRGLPAQRRAGADRHHRLLHADRRRPVRLRPHRRDQRDQRRLRDGRQADHGAGAGRHADQRAVRSRPSARSSRRRIGLPRGRASRSPAATPSIRSSRSTAWSRWAWSIPTGSSATPTRRPGDVLVLGKPLGVGVLSAALKKDALDAAGYAAHDRDHHPAQHARPRRWPRCDGVHALTDVTGFGLAGHALELARGAGWTCAIDWAKVPLLPGVARAGARRLRHRRVGPQLGGLRRRGRAAAPASPPRTRRCSPIRRPAAACWSPATPAAVDAVLGIFRRHGFARGGGDRRGCCDAGGPTPAHRRIGVPASGFAPPAAEPAVGRP